MEFIQAAIMGIIQGITEFFPVSSSGNLVAFKYLFNWDFVDNRTFDIALHFGTLLAICIYFFKDWLDLVLEGFKLKSEKGKINFEKYKERKLTRTGRMFWFLVAATIPGVIAGFLLDDVIEKVVIEGPHMPIILATTLTVMGILLFIIDKKSKADVTYETMTFKNAIIVGIAQAFAIVPGFSRSGTTMTMARALKIDRESAAKFSFLLGTPIMAGAVVLHIKDLLALTMAQIMPLLVGVVVSFVVGIICIKALMALIKKMGFGVFAIYRFLLAAALVITYIARG